MACAGHQVVKVLLDTNVLSALRDLARNPEVEQVLSRHQPDERFVSVLTLGEIQLGIALLVKGKNRAAISAWASEIETIFGDRILGVSLPIAKRWGELIARARQLGTPTNPPDSLIAATALHHGLSVMTRNVRDFAQTGVTVINPWTD